MERPIFIKHSSLMEILTQLIASVTRLMVVAAHNAEKSKNASTDNLKKDDNNPQPNPDAE